MASSRCLLALLSLVSLLARAGGQTCHAQDFSVMYDGQAYFTVSSLNGTVLVSGPMTVGGMASFPGGIAVGASASFNGPLTTAGPTTLAGVVTATNGVTITNGGLQMAAGNHISSAGSATFAGLLTANGGISTTTIASSGGLTVNGGVGVTVNTGGVTINNGGLTVNAGGLTVANGQTVNIGTSVSSTPLSVWGPTSLRNGLAITAGGLTVSNGQTVSFGTSGTSTPTTVYGLLTATGGITLTGGSLALGSAAVSGSPTFSGLITAGGGLTLGASQTLSLPSTATLALNGAAVTGMPSITVSGSVTATSFIGSAAALTSLGSQPEFAAVAAKVNAMANSGAINGACQSTSDCSGALVCHRGQCKVRLGNACSSHQQCMTDVHGCVSSVCSFYSSCSAMRTANPGAVSGYYPIVLTGGRRARLWCNFDTVDEGWTVVWSNHRGGSGKALTNMVWNNAISGVFEWKTASTTTSMPVVPNPEDMSVYVGLSFWASLAPRGRLRYDWTTDYGQPIVQSYECSYTLSGSNYVITLSSCAHRVGSTVPGLHNSHSGSAFSTTDRDNDSYVNACSNHYSGTPWWYNSCWSGNINGGGETTGSGYYNGAYWSGSAVVWGNPDGTGAGNGWILLS